MRPIIVELAGRDSVVALLKFAEDIQEGQTFVFSVVKTPPEDNSDFILNLGEILQVHLENMGHRILKMVNIEDVTDYWMRLLNVNTAGKFEGVYSPCIACHTLCHLSRLPILKEFDTPFLLTGERYKHQDSIKENQNDEVLSIFDKIFDKFGIEFIRPIANVNDTKMIEQRYNEFCSQYGIDSSNDLFRKCMITNKKKEVPEYVYEYCMNGLFPELSIIAEELTKLYEKEV